MTGESSINVNTLLASEKLLCSTERAQSGALWWPDGMGRGEGKEAREGGDVCIITADSHSFMEETWAHILMYKNINVNGRPQTYMNPVIRR